MTNKDLNHVYQIRLMSRKRAKYCRCCECAHQLTRLWVAKDGWAAAECRTAAVVTTAPTAAAQAAPPSADHHLYLFGRTH